MCSLTVSGLTSARDAQDRAVGILKHGCCNFAEKERLAARSPHPHDDQIVVAELSLPQYGIFRGDVEPQRGADRVAIDLPTLSIIPVLFPSRILAVHLLQELAQGVQLCPEACPIPGLQALDRLVVAVERLARAVWRRAS